MSSTQLHMRSSCLLGAFIPDYGFGLCDGWGPFMYETRARRARLLVEGLAIIVVPNGAHNLLYFGLTTPQTTFAQFFGRIRRDDRA
jgi:hypothetical protein